MCNSTSYVSGHAGSAPRTLRNPLVRQLSQPTVTPATAAHAPEAMYRISPEFKIHYMPGAGQSTAFSGLARMSSEGTLYDDSTQPLDSAVSWSDCCSDTTTIVSENSPKTISSPPYALSVLACQLSPLVTEFPPDLLAATLERLLFCYYGYCMHSSCSALRRPMDLNAELAHCKWAFEHSSKTGNYLCRILLRLAVTPEELELGVDIALRLRRTLEANKPDLAPASRIPGTHYLVLLTGLFLANKLINDYQPHGVSEWADAGGFCSGTLRKSEVELLGMLDYNLDMVRKPAL